MRLAFAAFALAGCGFTISGGSPLDARDDANPIDGDPTVDGTADAPIDPPIDGPPATWSAPQPLGIDDCDDPTLTGDLLHIWFDRAGDIYHASRGSTTQQFGSAEKVLELSTANSETTPEVSADGRFMTIGRTIGNVDIYIASRGNTADLWSSPVTVDVNSVFTDASAVISTDRTMMALSSHRAAPNTTGDIYISTRATPQDVWGTPAYVTEINVPNVQDGSVFLSGDKLTICIDSFRNGASMDIYCAKRAQVSDAFSTPVALTEINSPQSDEDPWLSPDGKTIVFYSNRDGTGKLWYSTHP